MRSSEGLLSWTEWAADRLCVLKRGFLRFAVLFLLTGIALAAPAVAEASCTANVTTPANTPVTRDIYDDYPQCQADLQSFTPGPITQAPAHGAVAFGVVAPDFYTTGFRYTPNTNYAGSDTFVFRGDTPTAFITVNITVTPTAPVAAASSTTVGYGSTNTNIPLSLTGVAATSVAIVSNVTHGSTAIAGTTISYTPAAGYAGPDSFTYNATNAAGTSSTVTVSLTVSAPTIVVGPPTLPNGTVGTAYSQSVTGSGGASPYTYAISAGTQPTGLTLSTAGVLSGTPTAANSFTFTVRATDSTTGPAQPYSATRSYTVVIVAPPAPVAGAASATVAYNSTANPITLNLSGGAPTSVAVASPATNGTATASGTTITYTPTAGYFGPDSFTYTATNGGGTSSPATVTITVNPQPPVTGAVSATVALNSTNNPITLSLSGGAPVSLATPSLPVHGTVQITGLAITYTPTAGYFGSDSFTYTATNAGGTSAPATVSLTVNPSAPIAGAASATVAYNSAANPITLNLSGGAPTSVAVASPAANGTATASGTTITYTPTAGYFGPDSFTYTATNGGGTSTPATVTITVNPQPPIAGTVSATVAFNSTNNPITLSLSGGAAVSLATPSLPVNGTIQITGLTITYTPTAGYSGGDSFTYTATNAGGTSALAAVSITVNPTAPIAGAASATVAYNSAANPITLNITGGAPASVAVASPAANGTATASGTTITYTPTAGYNGPDSFTYTATNAGGTSTPATVTITVNPQPPVTGAVSATVAFNSSNNPITLSLSGGTPVSLATPSLPANGTVQVIGLAITYTPTAGYFGSDSFTYTATNAGGTSAPATISITVNPTAPIAGAASATVAYGSSNNPITLNITGGAAASVATPSLPANGTVSIAGTTISYTPTAGYFGGDSFTYTATNAGGTSAAATVSITVTPQTPTTGAVSATVAFDSTNNPITLDLGGGTAVSLATPSLPANGTVQVTGLAITYTPTAGYFGSDSFTYTATNAGGTSAPATVSITVNPTAPIAGAASATVAYGSNNNPITLNITGGAAASVATPSLPASGTVSIAGTAITYTPTAGYFGSDSFTYTATNAGGTSAPATVSITVTPQTPIAGAVSATVAYNSSNTPITLNITGGAAASVATPSLPANGTVSIVGAAITYTPTAGYFGPDSFTYTATNAGGTSSAATVSITVTPQAPIAGAASATVAFESTNNPITLAITGGAPVSVATPGLPTNGTVAIAGTAITYTPNTGYAGSDSFTYTATNAGGTSAPATVSITVNTPPPPVTGAVTETVAANDSNAPMTLSLTGGTATSLATPTLPLHGTVTISGLTITYTPTAGFSGSDSFTYTATNLGGTSAPATVTVTVSAPTLTLSALATTGEVTAAYSDTVTASLGTAPYGYAVTAGALPPGLTLASGLVSGTATAAGTFNFTITATDTYGASGNRAYAITIAAPTITITAPAAGALPGVEAYGAVSQTFTATGGVGPRSFAVTAGALPPGLTLSGGGVLSGAPTTPGTFNFSVTATDASVGAPGPYSSAPVAYSLTVSAPTITVAPAGMPGATTALAYSQTVSASGGIGPYGYAVTAGAIPSGLTLSAAGVLSGTPTAAGTYNFTVTATDSHAFTGLVAYSVTVADPVITITSPAAGALPSVEAYAAYSQTLTATGGQGAHSFSLVAGALPPGIGLTGAGVISGTPTSPGTFNFSVAAADSSGAPGPFSSTPVAYSVTVTAPVIAFTPTTLPAATTAVAYSQTFSASGGIGPYSYALTAGALPAGIGLSGGGLVSGTPTAAGTYNFTVTVSDSHSFTAANAYSITVADPTVTVTSPAAGSLPGAVAYAAYSQSFTASGGQGAHSFSLVAGALPPGMGFTSGGVLSGAPTASGTFNFSIAAADSSGAPGPFVSVPVAYSVTVSAPAIGLTPTTLPSATTAVAYNETFSASGGVGPYSYAVTAGALPAGISLSGGGLVSGTPTAAGTYNFTVTVSDSNGFSASNAYAVVVTDPTVTITTPAPGALPGVEAYAAYNQVFAATGGQGAHSFALAAGALPPGLSLSGSGVLSGAPTTPGTFNFSLTAADSSGAPGPFVSAPVAYSLTITAPTVSFTPATLPAAVTAVAYSQTFTGAGGIGPYSYLVSAGALPPGLSLSAAGVLSGTPTAAGSYAFTVTGADSHGFDADNAYTVVVTDPTVTITTPAAGALPGGVAYTPYNQAFTASGGQGAHSFTVVAGALPPGISLSSSGVLSGAPTATGTFNFSLTAADSSGAPGPFVSVPVAYSLAVAAPTISFTPATLANGVTGDAYSQTFTGAGGTAPYAYTLTSGALPPGLALQATGTLAGAPTAPGAFSFGVTATDANGFAATNPYSLTIVDASPVAEPDSASTPANQPVTVPVTANDTGVITSIAVATVPSHGTAVVSGLNVAYTPAANYFGADSFTYTATGPGGTSAPATVSITVTPLAVPTAEAKTAAVLSGNTATIDAVAGSTGAPITAVTVAASPGHGTATVSGQSLLYTPAAGYSGTDSFTYTLTNPFGVSAPAIVTVTVNPAPIAAPPITVEIMAGQVATVNLSVGATGGPFTGAAVVAVTPSGAGTTAIAADAAGYLLSFTPDNSFAGTAVVSYTLTNAFATSAPGTVTVIVTARPDPTQDPEVTGLIGAQDEAARRFAGAQISNYNSRLESLRDGGGSGISANLGFSGGSRELIETLDPVTRRRFAELGMIDPSPMGYDALGGNGISGGSGSGGLAGGRASPDGGGGNSFAGDEPSRLGLWAAGVVDFGERDRSRNQAGVEFSTDGLTAGADYRFSDQLVLGAGIGWGHDDSRVGGNGTRSQADGYSFAVYGSYQPVPSFFIDGVLGYGTLEFDSRRFISATGDFAIGQRDGDQWFGAVTGGWDMRGGAWQLSPYGRLSSTLSRLDAFEESTGGLYALAYDEQTVRTLTGTLGLRGAYSYGVDLGAITPRFRFEYSHDFQGAERTRLSYVDWVGGPVYGAYIAPLERNRILGGLGVDILTLGGMRISLDYETLLGSDGRQQQVRIQVQTPF